MTTNKFIGKGPKKVLAAVAGGILGLSAGALLIQCTGVDEGSASANAQVAATRSAVTSSLVETCPSPTPVPPLVDPDSQQVCHPSVCTPGFCARGDIAPLATHPVTGPLLSRLLTLDCSPHSIPAAPGLRRGGPHRQPRACCSSTTCSTARVFSPACSRPRSPGINDDPSTQKTVWGANCNLSTIGSVRIALEPKPDLPTDPDDPRAFIDIFTDIRGLFVINNESGWYEGWMIHDLRVAPIAGSTTRRATPRSARSPPRTPRSCATMGTGNNVAGTLLHRRRQGAAPARARAITSRSGSPTSSRSSSAWARTTRSSSPMLTVTGSSTTRRTGSTRSTSCRLPAASPIDSRPQPADTYRGRRDRPARSRSFPATGG